ncbi:AIR synthase-related protein, partial [Bacillus sp. SIMBA_161]
GLIQSAHDCAEGGVTVALAESCLSGSLGVSVTLSPNENQRWDECLFGEGASRIIVSVSPDNQEAWEAFLQQNLGTSWQYLG